MIGLQTELARQQQAAAMKAQKKPQRPQGTPAHAAAEGAAEFHDGERDAREEQLEKAFTPSRPYLEAGQAANSPSNPPAPSQADYQVGDRVGYDADRAQQITAHGIPIQQVYGPTAAAPQALVELHTAGGGALASSIANNPGTAVVQRLDLAGHAGGAGLISPAVPVQPADHIAPTGKIPPQPRGGGNASPTNPGA